MNSELSAFGEVVYLGRNQLFLTFAKNGPLSSENGGRRLSWVGAVGRDSHGLRHKPAQVAEDGPDTATWLRSPLAGEAWTTALRHGAAGCMRLPASTEI